MSEAGDVFPMLGRWITVEQRQGTPTRFYQNRAGNAPFPVPAWARHDLNRIPKSFRVAARADLRASGRWFWTSACPGAKTEGIASGDTRFPEEEQDRGDVSRGGRIISGRIVLLKIK